MVRVKVENLSANYGMKFGWVGGSTVTLVTSEGEHFYNITMDFSTLGPLEEMTRTFTFPQATGEFLSLSIDNIVVLNGSLPKYIGSYGKVVIPFNRQ